MEPGSNVLDTLLSRGSKRTVIGLHVLIIENLVCIKFGGFSVWGKTAHANLSHSGVIRPISEISENKNSTKISITRVPTHNQTCNLRQCIGTLGHIFLLSLSFANFAIWPSSP